MAGNVPFAQEVSDLHWHRAVATWYGSPEGDGSDGKCLKCSTVLKY